MPIDSKSFVTEIKKIRIDGVFNPYVDRCPHDDLRHAPAIRSQNLHAYLDALNRVVPTAAWIGRDLGYRGGRRTGLPLTDEAHLRDFAMSFRTAVIAKATAGQVIAERTATEIWGIIPQLTPPPLLWNVVPFHPHQAGSPFSNVPHTPAAAASSEPLLKWLLSAFPLRTVCALGRDAQAALDGLGLHPIYVRHPSYGGEVAFRQTMAQTFRLSRLAPRRGA